MHTYFAYQCSCPLHSMLYSVFVFSFIGLLAQGGDGLWTCHHKWVLSPYKAKLCIQQQKLDWLVSPRWVISFLSKFPHNLEEIFHQVWRKLQFHSICRINLSDVVCFHQSLKSDKSKVCSKDQEKLYPNVRLIKTLNILFKIYHRVWHILIFDYLE